MAPLVALEVIACCLGRLIEGQLEGFFKLLNWGHAGVPSHFLALEMSLADATRLKFNPYRIGFFVVSAAVLIQRAYCAPATVARFGVGLIMLYSASAPYRILTL